MILKQFSIILLGGSMVDFKTDLDHHDNVNSPAHYLHGKKETI